MYLVNKLGVNIIGGWLEGTIIDVENNSFNGIVLTVKSDDGRMFFGQLCFFRHVV